MYPDISGRRKCAEAKVSWPFFKGELLAFYVARLTRVSTSEAGALWKMEACKADRRLPLRGGIVLTLGIAGLS